jgi:hypothetical protein
VAQTKNNSRAAQQTARQLIEVQRRQAQKRSNMIRAGIAVVAVLAVVGIIVGVALSQNSKKPAAAPASVAPSALINEVTGMSPAVLDQIGKGKSNPLPSAISGNPVKTVNGKPNVLYVGAEYCPYCAAQRWPMIVALSRFGTFSGLKQITSYEDNIPTFTFDGSTYTSDYVNFQPMEINGNGVGTDGRPLPLETLSADQSATFQKLNPDGSFPFLDFADQSTVIGASYSKDLLAGKTQAQVAAELSNPDSEIAQSIGGTANAFTAQICKLTNNQPANVCSSAAVKAYNGG